MPSHQPWSAGIPALSGRTMELPAGPAPCLSALRWPVQAREVEPNYSSAANRARCGIPARPKRYALKDRVSERQANRR